jgi:hypothetical protein
MAGIPFGSANLVRVQTQLNEVRTKKGVDCRKSRKPKPFSRENARDARDNRFIFSFFPIAAESPARKPDLFSSRFLLIGYKATTHGENSGSHMNDQKTEPVNASALRLS